MAASDGREKNMKIEIENGTVTVRNSPQHTPRCLDITTHLCGRKVASAAHHQPARDKNHKDGKRDAYIVFDVSADERDYEVPPAERDTELFRKRSTNQSTFLSVADARALRDALTAALACADIK